MEDDQTSPPPRRQQPQNQRSSHSINWRVKDDSPRQDSPQQGRFRRGGDTDGNGYEQNNSPRNGGYGGAERRGYNDYQPREREQREIPDKPESSRLYVGNLLYTAQASDITNFFNSYGFNVVNVSMSIDSVTGRNPSYCFVDLESIEDATRAMEQLNGAEVLGRSVRINPGVARKEGQSGGQRRGFGSGTGAAGGWRERERENNTMSDSAPRERSGWSSGNTQSPRPPPVEQSKRLYVGGLPPIEPASAVEAEITTLFSRVDPPIEIASVSNLIAPHPSKASEPGDHHYLFVDLKLEQDADRAIEMFNDVESPWSENGKLRVNRARESRDRDRGGEGREGGGNRRGGREGGTGGRGYAPRGTWRTSAEQ